jgi:hypothetical protein
MRDLSNVVTHMPMPIVAKQGMAGHGRRRKILQFSRLGMTSQLY